MGSASDDAFLMALGHHGVSEQARRQVLRISQQLRRAADREDRELAAMVDAESGAQLGRFLRGTLDRVDIRLHIQAMRPGRSYVQIHTHPRDTAFSAQDALTFAAQPDLRSMIVLGQEGTRYLLSRDPSKPLADLAVIGRTYRAALNRARVQHWRLVRSGAMTREAAARASAHEAWLTVASDLGFRYDRVEPN